MNDNIYYKNYSGRRNSIEAVNMNGHDYEAETLATKESTEESTKDDSLSQEQVQIKGRTDRSWLLVVIQLVICSIVVISAFIAKSMFIEFFTYCKEWYDTNINNSLIAGENNGQEFDILSPENAQQLYNQIIDNLNKSTEEENIETDNIEGDNVLEV